MPRRSIAKIPDRELAQWKNQLHELISSLNKNELSSFLDEFLTAEETVMLSKRLLLYSLLYNKLPGKDVQQTLGVSRETIRLYDHLKDEKGPGFKSIILSVIIKEKKKSESKDKLANFVDLAIKSRSNSKARAKLYQGDLD